MNFKDFLNEDERLDEAMLNLRTYDATEDMIRRLTKMLKSNGVLSKSISSYEDVTDKFNKMHKHINQIEQIWGQIDEIVKKNLK